MGEEVAPITEAEVLECQKNWANAIKTISKTYLDGGDYIGEAGKQAGILYGYGNTNVLFKPTKATDHPFRPTGEEAMSYFVGGDVVENGYVGEDAGFAINGGKGWSDVVFRNHQLSTVLLQLLWETTFSPLQLTAARLALSTPSATSVTLMASHVSSFTTLRCHTRRNRLLTPFARGFLRKHIVK